MLATEVRRGTACGDVIALAAVSRGAVVILVLPIREVIVLGLDFARCGRQTQARAPFGEPKVPTR